MDAALMVMLISAVMIVAGVCLWQKGYRILRNGKKVEAIVFKNNYQTGPSRSGAYYPVVRFLTDKQEWITQELSMGYLPAIPEGTKLEVMYDHEDPTNVQIDSPFHLKMLPKSFVVLGVVGFIFGTLEYLNITHFILSK